MPAEYSDINILTGLLARVTAPGEPRPHLAAVLCGTPSLSRFLDHCPQHGLAPLVYRNLKALGLHNSLDAQTLEGLKGAYYRVLADNLRLLGDLRETARESAEAGIPPLVLKGPALIHLVYRDPALRPMTDIDLLVRPSDRPRLQAVLKKLGYTPVPLYPDLFQRGKTVLDLHTEPVNRSRIEGRASALRLDIHALWRGALPLPDFPPLRMLGLEDQILTLCIHALKHGFQRKIWLVDIAGCLDLLQTEEEWKKLFQRHRKCGTTGILALTLYMVQDRLQRELPPPAGRFLAATRLPPLSRRLLQASSQPGMPQILEPLVLMQAIRGIRGKISYLLEAAFPRPEILAQVSGLNSPWTFWLSYPYRLVQLFGMACQSIFRLGRQILKRAGPAALIVQTRRR